MTAINKKCTVSEILPVGDDGFFEASLSLYNHSDFIKVIGGSLTECVKRCVIIIDAFENS